MADEPIVGHCCWKTDGAGRLLPAMRRSSLLRELGLPLKARREDALPLAVRKIVNARNRKDDASAAFWSEAKNFLLRILHHLCPGGCGELIPAKSFQCRHCQHEELLKTKQERYQRSKADDDLLRASIDPLHVFIRKQERDYIRNAILVCKNKDVAARILEIDRATLYRKVKLLGEK